MRTTVIPAQITTVEDKIAGNLNLTQIVLLMLPVFWATAVYTFFFPQMRFAWYKMPVILLVVCISLTLALRIKKRLVLHWLTILLRYNLRPKYFVFNKNDAYLRSIDLPIFEKRLRKVPAKTTAKATIKKSFSSLSELLRVEDMIANPKYTFSIKSGKKGGLNVALKQV